MSPYKSKDQNLEVIKNLQKDVEIQLRLEKLVDKIIDKGYANDLKTIMTDGLIRTPWKKLKQYDDQRQFFRPGREEIKKRFDQTMRNKSKKERDDFFSELVKRFLEKYLKKSS